MKINAAEVDRSPLLDVSADRTLRDQTPWFIGYLFLALLVNLAGILIPINTLIKYDYTNQGQILNGGNVFGIVWVFFSVTVGPLLIGLTLIEMSRSRMLHPRIGAVLAVIFGLGCLGGTVPAWKSLIEPEMTFVGAVYNDLHPADQVRQFLGGAIAVVYPFVAIACFAVAFKLAQRGKPSMASATRQPYDSILRRWKGIAVLVVMGALLWFATSIFSGTWNYGTSYFQGYSPYNVGPNTTWTFGPSPTDDETWLREPIVVLKLYEDVCVWFGIVLGVSVISAALLSVPGVRRILHRRVAVVPGVHEWFAEWGRGYSIGEILLLLCVTALYGYNFWYWAYGFDYIDMSIAAMGDQYPGIQKWARVTGHMATLTMSLLLMPVARNSVWESCFGVPFERFVKYHRGLGRTCWLLVTLHMMLFQIKWIYEGTLWNNVFTISNLLITPMNPTCIATDPEAPTCLHADNFTIVIVEAAWLVLTLVLVAAWFCRRWRYELFQYTHYLTWFFLVSTIMHAWTHWYYVALGFFLYMFDKLARVVRSCNESRLVSLNHTAGVTRVEVSRSAVSGVHDAGQYAFVNVPAVSQLQWHPFTISSAPSDALANHGSYDGWSDTITFHIKDMGPGTWTHDLAELARAHQASKNIEEITVSVDGPYGRPPPYHEKHTLIMVAGGIGITPFHAILSDLHAQANRTSVRDVHLIWAARDADLVAVFARTWASLLRSNVPNGPRFNLHLHCTARGDVNLPGLGDDDLALVKRYLVTGRPQLASEFAEICRVASKTIGTTSLYDDVLAMVCGPHAMIDEVSALASKHGTDFFSEVFTF